MELSGCPERWVDVFVTKQADDPVNGGAYLYDDTFCCTVQSIEFEIGAGAGTTRAYITENDSPWILPTWTKEYDTASPSHAPYKDIKVGDLVRIGGVHTDGFTDYLTVVEIVDDIEILCNACSTDIKISKNTTTNVDGIDNISVSTTTTDVPTATDLFPAGYNTFGKLLTKAGIAHRALRLNASINATKLPSFIGSGGPVGTIPLTSENSQNHAFIRQAAYKNTSNPSQYFCDLSTRDHAYDFLTPGPNNPDEKYYYPLYKAKNWVSGTVLTAKLDHGVKQVAAVKLLGYSLVNKRAVGIQHAHEMQADDYLILRIREIDGHVISNNKYANGAFAVLRAGDSTHQVQGATEFSAYEPAGIVCVPVHQTNSTLRNLTIEVTDRLGRPAHFGRFHLWFKLLVTHG